MHKNVKNLSQPISYAAENEIHISDCKRRTRLKSEVESKLNKDERKGQKKDKAPDDIYESHTITAFRKPSSKYCFLLHMCMIPLKYFCLKSAREIK